MSSLSRTIKRNSIKRLAGMYKQYENRKMKIKDGKIKDMKKNRFDMRKILKAAFKGDVTFLKVKDKIILKDNKPVQKAEKKVEK
jgi:hypothetical protein